MKIEITSSFIAAPGVIVQPGEIIDMHRGLAIQAIQSGYAKEVLEPEPEPMAAEPAEVEAEPDPEPKKRGRGAK